MREVETFRARRAKALELIRRVHAGQARSGGVPVWHHLDRVSLLLEYALDDAKEGSEEERQTIALAGLGHDALEDTAVTREELAAHFGARGLALIDGMTNTLGDDHPEPYVRQVAAAEEGVRLIKLSDLYDNCTSVIHTLPALGVKWNEDYFLPIVRPMIVALLETGFTEYPETATRLKAMVRVSYALLLEEHEKIKTQSSRS